jgi:flavin-dependent dehydrogenase
MYDAIIVGARCAGSATAMLLARKGLSVLVVDRASFPSDTLSTHWLHEPAVEYLRQWALLDDLLATGCPRIESLVADFGVATLRGTPVPAGETDFALCPRRTVLDKLLVDAARQAGAEVREGFRVHELEWEDGRVVGIRGGEGDAVVERAPIVIGADGQHSIVARAVSAPQYNARPSLSCFYYSYWTGLPTDGAALELFARDGNAAGLFPTHDGLTLVAVTWNHSRFHEVRSDIESHYLNAAEYISADLRARLDAAQRAEKFYGTGDLPNFYREPYGPGWALVGDAGYHKDPCTAQGITDAFRDAELLTTAIEEAMTGQRSHEEAFGAYEQARNDATMPIYEFTCALAPADPLPPEMQTLFRAMEHNQEATNRFLGVIAGTVPVPEFMAPENIESIVGAAASAPR